MTEINGNYEDLIKYLIDLWVDFMVKNICELTSLYLSNENKQIINNFITALKFKK